MAVVRVQGNGDAKAIGYGTSAGELIEFTGRNWPEGAMLLMDSDPLQFDSERRFFGGNLEAKPSTSNLQTEFFPPGARPLKTFMAVP